MDTNQQQPAVEQQQGQGYISTSYFGNKASEMSHAQKAQQANMSQIEELGQKLGIKPEDLASNPEQQEGVPQEGLTPDQAQEVDDFMSRFDSEQGKAFMNQFKQFTGIDIQEAYNLVNDSARLVRELEEWRGQVQTQEQQKALRNEWSDFDDMMPRVVERFKTLPANMQKSLDNIDGARMLYAMLKQEEAQSRNQMLGGQANQPQYVYPSNTRRLNAGNPAPQIRMSEMVKWSGTELDQRLPDVMRAKAEGRFIYDL